MRSLYSMMVKKSAWLLFSVFFPFCVHAFELNGAGAAELRYIEVPAASSYVLAPVKARPSRLIVEPDDGRAPFLDAIKSASTSITLTTYQLSDPQIVSALKEARQRGVKVRFQYNYYSFADYTTDPNGWAVGQLTGAGAEARPGQKYFLVTHEKAMVVDNSTAFVMGLNFAKSYFSGTRDFGYVTSDPVLVGEITRFFEADWTGVPAVPAAGALAWSPVNARAKMTALVNNARGTLDIYNELALDKKMLAAMCAAAGRGVKVRFINAAAHPKEDGKEDPNKPGREQLAAAGVRVKVITSPFIHAKAILADNGTAAAKAYIGSGNFSAVSFDRNRELGVITSEKQVLDPLQKVFDQDWAR